MVFAAAVDRSVPAERSILLRYRRALAPLLRRRGISVDEGFLVESSIQEGVSILRLGEHKGVELRIMDETSRMASGSFKSIDACLTVALCRSSGIRTAVCETGGNLGAALALYANPAKLRIHFVLPERSLELPSGSVILGSGHPFTAIRRPEEVKRTSAELARRLGAMRIPRLEWRYAAAMFRGCRVLELLLEDKRVDWLSQTVSAGFGPVGIYRLLRAFSSDLPAIPRFLAVQQEENAPFYRRIRRCRSCRPSVGSDAGRFPFARSRRVGARRNGASGPERLLIPVMYDRNPFSYGSFREFKGLLRSKEHIVTVGAPEFGRFLLQRPGRGFVSGLAGQAYLEGRGHLPDNAGLVGLAGVVKAIEAGTIREGETVLHALTSGALPSPASGEPPRAASTSRGASAASSRKQEPCPR